MRENSGPILSRLCNKVHDILKRVLFRRCRPLKLPLSCEIVEKRWFWGPRFAGEGYTPQTSHMHFANPIMSPVLAEFRSANLERSGRKKDR